MHTLIQETNKAGRQRPAGKQQQQKESTPAPRAEQATSQPAGRLMKGAPAAKPSGGAKPGASGAGGSGGGGGGGGKRSHSKSKEPSDEEEEEEEEGEEEEEEEEGGPAQKKQRVKGSYDAAGPSSAAGRSVAVLIRQVESLTKEVRGLRNDVVSDQQHPEPAPRACPIKTHAAE